MKEDLSKEVENLKVRLAEAEHDKAALFKMVSHDLRSPMNNLFALIGLLKITEETLTEEQASYLNTMELVISDGLNKIRNLMDLRTIEDKGIKIVPEKFSLGKLIAKVVREFNLASSKKNIHLKYQEKAAIINSDKLSCQRIFEHLLSNAIKYSPHGSTIEITLEETINDYLIAVVDGGYGISEEEQRKLFHKFMVLSSRTTGSESATGIGLYIAQFMTKNIGGEIEYTNEEKSVFTLRLPKILIGQSSK